MRGELGVRQISEFLENRSLTVNFAETRKVDLLWKNDVFEVSEPIGVSGGKLGAIILLKTGLYKIFKAQQWTLFRTKFLIPTSVQNFWPQPEIKILIDGVPVACIRDANNLSNFRQSSNSWIFFPCLLMILGFIPYDVVINNF